MPKDPQQVSPLAPLAESVGFNDRRVQPGYSAAPEQGDLVEKGHAKHPLADPSLGSATSRVQGMEVGGARYRVHPPNTTLTVPEAAATQANGRVVGPSAAVHYDKDWDPSIDAVFNDAPTVADYPAGRQRLRGYTARQG